MADRPRIAHLAGPTATVQNSPPLVTSNKARQKYGLPVRKNPDGSDSRFDALRAQRLAAPATIYVECFSAHPLEEDAAELYARSAIRRSCARPAQRSPRPRRAWPTGRLQRFSNLPSRVRPSFRRRVKRWKQLVSLLGPMRSGTVAELGIEVGRLEPLRPAENAGAFSEGPRSAPAQIARSSIGLPLGPCARYRP